MLKLKTHSGASKRFRQTATSFKHKASNRNHILTKKSTKRKRHLRPMSLIAAGDKLSVTRLLKGS